jgi:hypothetical protein
MKVPVKSYYEVIMENATQIGRVWQAILKFRMTFNFKFTGGLFLGLIILQFVILGDTFQTQQQKALR